ncbi:MAG: hypothetical protein J6Y72_07335 [Bacteroidales bacterium]|nr:hypothetical protein [Bacteroidales bacterium]
MNKSLQVILLALLATACSEEIDMTEQTSETITYSDAELEKIAYGCDYYLDEGEDEKVETRATDEYLDYIGEYVLQNAQSSLKAHPISNGEGRVYVGVIKWKTCGQYPTIKIHYDCEDSKNKSEEYWYVDRDDSVSPNDKGKYKGSWEKDGNDNINMYFCRVPFEDFPVNAGSYALLRLSSKPLVFNDDRNDYSYILSVHMDAEDKHETTSLSIMDYKGSDILNVDSEVRNFVKVTSHGDLDFDLIYMGSYEEEKLQSQGYSFPSYGFEYGVFGLLKSGKDPKTGSKNPNRNYDYRAYFYSDDEDKSNGNYVKLKRQNTKNGHVDEIGDIYDRKAKEKYGVAGMSFDKLIEYSKSGTKFYMTRVDPKDIYE